MSRHYFDTVQGDQAVCVTLGYDRPLDYFFLTVERTPGSKPGETRDAEDEAGFVYSNLEDPELSGGSSDLEYYRAKLEELGISVPESMFREAELDAINGVGNRVVRHRQDGTIEAV